MQVALGMSRPISMTARHFANFAPVQAMLRQPLILQYPLSLGPFFIAANYDRDWDAARRDAALRKLLAAGCRVVVGGRADRGGVFRTWAGEGIAAEFRGLFVALGEDEFRVDVSSTDLRD